MKICCVSDLHGYFPDVGSGDLLIICGDLTARDTLDQHSDFLNWICKQNYKEKIVVAGNHDNFLAQNPNFYSKSPIKYLCDSGSEFEGLKIWGCPHSLWFPEVNAHCTAFMSTEPQLKKKYDLIPDDIDILISHTPPWGVLDKSIWSNNCGSLTLLNAVERVKPKYLICGHIHEAYGSLMYKHAGPDSWCINASHVNERYKPVNKPVRIEL